MGNFVDHKSKQGATNRKWPYVVFGFFSCNIIIFVYVHMDFI